MSLILDESSPGIAINVLSPKLPPCNKLPLDEMNCLSFGSCGCRSPLQATCWVLITECLYTWVCNSPSRLPNLLIPFQENGYSLEMMKTQWFGEDWSLFAWEKVKYRDRNFQSPFGGNSITHSSLERSPSMSQLSSFVTVQLSWQNAGWWGHQTVIH